MNRFDSLTSRRARALRAARAVTFSASIVGLAACGGGTDAADAAMPVDADPDNESAVPMVDACSCDGMDAGPVEDAPIAAMDAPATSDAPSTSDAPVLGDDAFVVADDAFSVDGGCGPAFPPTNQECCVLAGGFWDEAAMFCAIAVPGPFVPPSLEA